MRFIENKGQWGENVGFSTQLNFGNIYFEKNNFTFLLYDFGDYAHKHHEGECTMNHDENGLVKAHHFKILFEGANENISFEKEGKSDYYYNYFLGKNPDLWGSKAHTYKSVVYKNLYDGIDMKIAGEGDNMKYDYYVASGANPNTIKHKYVGVSNLKIENGNLTYKTNVADVTELKPYAYQIINGRKKEVKCLYKLEGNNTISFVFPSGYNPDYELIIDPVLIFSSYTGSGRDNFGFTATYDNQGRLYGGGMVRDLVFAGTEYPITPGAYDGTFNGVVDISISVFSPNGTTLLYSTFVGGNDGDIPNSMIVNNAGELVVLATTGSNNFPVTSNAYIDTFSGGVNANYLGGYGVIFNNGSDIAVFKLSTDGTQLLSSTYMGGSGNDGINDDGDLTFFYNGTDLHYNYGDVFRGEITVDRFDNVYIASSTNSADFPITPGAAKDTIGGIQDAISFKLNSDLSNLIWSTYYGGDGLDAGYSQKVDFDGNVVFCGGTNSFDFPTTGGALNETYMGGTTDGFIVKLNGTDGSVLSATLLGTDLYDQAFMIDVDEFNNVYVVGQSIGNYPVNTTGYHVPGSSQFIHKLSPDLSTSFFSTVFGNGSNLVNISPTAFQVDICERIYVSGWGGSVNRNNRNNGVGFTVNMPLTPDAFRNESQTDGSDFYIAVFEKNLNGLLYGTYLGGPAAEHVDGGTSRFDKNAIIYQAVCAGCGGNSTFPTTPGVVSQTNNSPNCNLAVLKMDIELPSTSVNVNAFPTATGCVPLTVNFESELINVSSFQWDFGDGNSSNDINPVHTYSNVGIYTVELIGIDSNSCNVADTAYLTVIVDDNRLEPNFSDEITIDCNILQIAIEGPTNYPATQYLWNMGDGNTYTTQNVNHTYNLPGDYVITLFLEDTTSCNPFDSTQLSVFIPPLFDVSIAASDTFGCVPLTVDFSGFSNTATTTFSWNFGDGNTTFGQNPQHTFNQTGIYEVRLTGTDPLSCNINDTAIIQIEVIDTRVEATFATVENWFDCDSLELLVYSTVPNASFHSWSINFETFFNDSAFTVLLGPGDYSFSYIVTDTNAICQSLDSTGFNLQILEKIELELIASDTSGCVPLSVDFLAVSSTPQTDFQWNFGNGNIGDVAALTNTYTNGGIYTVQLIGTDSSTCNISDTLTFEIEAFENGVIATFTQNETFFRCDSLQLDVSSTVSNATSHFWNFGNGTTSTNATAQAFYNAGVYNGFYIATDTNQFCNPVDTAFFNFNIIENVTASASASTTLGCIPLTIDFTSFTNSAQGNYLWNFGNGFTSTLENPTVTYNNIGVYNVTLIVTDSSSCNITDTAFITITAVNDSAIANIQVQEIFFGCDSLRVNLSANYTGGTHTWNMGNGDIVTGQNTSYTYTNFGFYTITYVLTDNDAICQNTDSASYEIEFFRTNAQVSASDTAGCIPLLVDFENLSSNSASYIWNDGLGNTGFSATLPSVEYASTGIFNFTLIAVDSSSCNITDTATISITTNNDAVTAAFSADIISNCDSLLSIEINNQSQNAASYFWDFETGTSTQTNPGTYNYNMPGNYTITLIAENTNLCNPYDTVSQTFTLLPNITASFTAEPNCEGLQINISNNSPIQADFVLWSFGNGTTSSEWQPQIAYANGGFYDITLTLIDSASCNITATDTQQVEIISYPVASFFTDSNYYIYPDLVTFVNTSNNYTDFVWTLGDGTTNNTEESFEHFFNGLYTFTNCITAYNEFCTDTFCRDLFIDFIRLIGVPNAFSPNGDGINDLILVEGEGIVALNFKIYNRWGEVVFETSDQSVGWDGVYKGVAQEMEVYTYFVDATFIDGENVKLRGNITLLR